MATVDTHPPAADIHPPDVDNPSRSSTVNIYLPTESPTTENIEWIHALSIPCSDINRLALRPLKWLRFATFAVCGAKGHLSTTPGGEVANYENISFNDLADRYYYTPDNEYHLVDYTAAGDRRRSSVITPRDSSFRTEVARRDGNRCVITRNSIDDCNAAHIIPRSKGDGYITFVVRDRFNLYDQLPFSFDDDVDIDCIQNGILLDAVLHLRFGSARVVFLKTPNFAMSSADVPRVEEGSIPANRTTMQYIVKPDPEQRHPVPQWDVQANWSVQSAPHSILLDFMYGAAVVNRWKQKGLSSLLEERFETDFKRALDEKKTKHSAAPKNDESEDEPDDPGDPDWKPWRAKRKRRKTRDASEGLLEAMDDVICLSMLLKRTTPQMIAAQREKRSKEEELRSQERSRDRVQDWLNS